MLGGAACTYPRATFGPLKSNEKTFTLTCTLTNPPCCETRYHFLIKCLLSLSVPQSDCNSNKALMWHRLNLEDFVVVYF